MAHGFSPSFSGDLKLVKSEDGYVNGIKFEAKPGAKAYRNHIRITAVLPDGRERCLTERKSKRDEKKDLPISAHELRVNNLILSDAYDHTHGFGVEGMERVYDNRAMMYTPVSIPCNTIEIPVEKLIHAKGYVTGQKVIVDIRNNDMGFLDLNDRKFFGVTTSTGQEDHELRSFYELLVVQGSLDLKECVAVGSELYISCDQRHQIMYTRGISFINGFKKNARIVQDNGKAVVKLVVDPVDSAFYAQQRLADSFHDVTNGDYSNPRAIEHFFSLYKNVRVFLSFNKSKILPVHGLSKQKLEDIRFDKDGIPTSVMEHFRNEYGFSSRAGEMPALEVRFMNGQHGFYPLDCLEILKCQKVPMFKYTLVSPTLHDDILKVKGFLLEI
uniref:PAZ domain-containing protein n=1 Tax=Panagrolaimus superbus TaxID=310955 RepID=A0A914ZG47_9BILA